MADRPLKAIGLGGSNDKTVGRNKSNKCWKKQSDRGMMNKKQKQVQNTYEYRMEQKLRKKAMKEIETELKEARTARNIAIHAKVKDREERKKINEMKSGTY